MWLPILTTWILSHVRHFVGEGKCPVALFKSFVERRPLLQTGHAMVCFFSTSVANETENYSVCFKLNQWTNILKVFVAGTSLKESDKKVCES